MLLNFLIYINKRKLNKMITDGYNYEEILKQSQKLDKLINIYMKNYLKFKKEKNTNLNTNLKKYKPEKI